MVVAYHEVSPLFSSYLYSVTAEQFREQLSAFTSQETPGESDVTLGGITFDDGHRSNFECAFPALQQVGLKATFFVLPGCIEALPEYLTWSQAREMVAAGHQIQSHGWSHRMLTHCTPHELHEELVRSKRELENRLGVSVTSLSLPGGRWNENVIAACGRAEYATVFHSNPWAKPKTLYGVHLRGRLTVTNRMNAQSLRHQLRLGSLPHFYLNARYAAKERLRTILGDHLYHRIWRWSVGFDPKDGPELQVSTRAHKTGRSQSCDGSSPD